VRRHFHPGSLVGLIIHARLRVVPPVARELASWRARAQSMPPGELREQALSSLAHKAFHCEGGALLAGRDPGRRSQLVPLIVAYQTLVDYLDNLCDRSSCRDPDVFEDLHRSVRDAVASPAPAGDYYARWPEAGPDGSYLAALVQTCQHALRALNNYAPLSDTALHLAGLYGDLQVLKHGPPERREGDLRAWWEPRRHLAPQLRWYEFAAAAGSTLALFHLFGVAANGRFDATAAEGVLTCYFQWICPLHILLDYLVDREEDEGGGDLNFISYYRDDEDAFGRLKFLIEGSRRAVAALPDRAFHEMIVEGLLGLYLADAKVDRQPGVQALARRLLRASSARVWFFYLTCRARRGPTAHLQPPGAYRASGGRLDP
jgi:tetraprenyl-beta-curcumene synthase